MRIPFKNSHKVFSRAPEARAKKISSILISKTSTILMVLSKWIQRRRNVYETTCTIQHYNIWVSKNVEVWQWHPSKCLWWQQVLTNVLKHQNQHHTKGITSFAFENVQIFFAPRLRRCLRQGLFVTLPKIWFRFRITEKNTSLQNLSTRVLRPSWKKNDVE